MSDMELDPNWVPVTVLKADGTPQIIADAMEAVKNRDLPIEDRAAIYGVLHQIQLRINRALKAAKDDLIVHMESNGLRDFGPLSTVDRGVDVRWPVNDEGNWDDADTQERLEAYHRIAPDYIRRVPEHYEIKTAELGKGVYDGDPVARELHRDCKQLGFRTEEAKTVTLAVREAKPSKERAA